MKRCPACGKVVPRGHGYKKSQQYCSYRCYQIMTPKMIKMQKELGQPIREVIVEHLNKNHNIPVTAEIIGISKVQLYQWIDKLGIKKVLYYE